MKNPEEAKGRQLPILTVTEDIDALCGYLATKPTGALLKDAKAVVDGKHLDARKTAAMKYWGFIDEDASGKLKIKELGRTLVKTPSANRTPVYQKLIREIAPYQAIIERAVHRKEDTLTATDVAAHWHEHFPQQVAKNDNTLNDQAVCFFRIAAAAGIGNLIMGRNGQATRFTFDHTAAGPFIQDSPSDDKPVIESLTDTEKGEPESQAAASPARPVVPTESNKEVLGQAIFIAHGKNRKPLEQLKKILDQFKIPYRVAVEEPNLGRPIGAKVREIMKTCNCAILIFTADEEFKDKDGKTVWRPSENVSHELGASGYLYDNRIVILKEADVSLPSNFRDIGYISFDKDQLDAKAMDVLKELIGFGIVKVSTRACKVERAEKRRKLFPITLTDYTTLKKWECLDSDTGEDLAEEVRKYHIPDFSNWKTHAAFERAFARLEKDLRTSIK